jgi:hypothetical protein
VLASVMFALALYQLVLAAVGYGKLRPRFLDSDRTPSATTTAAAAASALSSATTIASRPGT